MTSGLNFRKPKVSHARLSKSHFIRGSVFIILFLTGNRNRKLIKTDIRWTHDSFNARLTYNYKDYIIEFVQFKEFKRSASNENTCQQIAAALQKTEVVLELGFISFTWTHI